MTATIHALEGLLDGIDLFDTTLDQLELTGEITTIEANQFIEARESITVGDKQVPFNVRYRFVDPILSSVILRKTKTPTNPEGRIDFNATIVSHRQMEVQVGDQWMDLGDFAAAAIKASTPTAANQSNETILHTLRQYGWDPSARLPMYLQHLGAGIEAFDEVTEHFQSLGALNNTEDVKSRAKGNKSEVVKSYRHQAGVPVLSMETSKANRELSATGSGFIGFLDGTWSTFTKVLTAHRTRIALKQIMDNPKSSEADKQLAAAREIAIRNLFTVPVSARAFRNWGGTSEVKDVLDDNAPSTFYAQQVPCGRLTVFGDKVYSVWTTSRAGIATPAATPLVAALPELDESTY